MNLPWTIIFALVFTLGSELIDSTGEDFAGD